MNGYNLENGYNPENVYTIQELHVLITRQGTIIDNLRNRIELMELIEAQQLLPKIDDLIARIKILEHYQFFIGE